MKIEDVLKFATNLAMKYGTSPLMEITITREAGVRMLQDVGVKAQSAVFFLDENGNVTWKDFTLTVNLKPITIKNGEYHDKGPV